MKKNLTEILPGNFNSLSGYAAEALITGHALYCGYSVFVQAWRDGKYDIVLDCKGQLFRCSIKSTAKNTISFTTGGRGGKQIDSSKVNPAIINKQDCDFIICYSYKYNSTYIVPVEFLQCFNRKSLSLTTLEIFRNRWELFLNYNTSVKLTKKFLNESVKEQRKKKKYESHQTIPGFRVNKKQEDIKYLLKVYNYFLNI